MGELRLSLEDVAMLTSLLLFSEAHCTSLYAHGEDKKRTDFLTVLVEVFDHQSNIPILGEAL